MCKCEMSSGTSVRLIYYPKSTADSEITMADMKILKPVSKSHIDVPMIPQKNFGRNFYHHRNFWRQTFFQIIEYQISALFYQLKIYGKSPFYEYLGAFSYFWMKYLFTESEHDFVKRQPRFCLLALIQRQNLWWNQRFIEIPMFISGICFFKRILDCLMMENIGTC